MKKHPTLIKVIISILIVILLLGGIFTINMFSHPASNEEDVTPTATEKATSANLLEQDSDNTSGETSSPAFSAKENKSLTSNETTPSSENIITTNTPDEIQNEGQVQNQTLANILSNSPVTTEQLARLNCKQLITVSSNGNLASIMMFTKNNNEIWYSNDLDTYGYIGYNGITYNKQEGDKKTPAGLYSIGQAFYINDKPQTGLNTFQITPDTYWVDDANSKFYNQKVIGTENKDWNSAESMYYISNYIYGFTINYNTSPIKSGEGSAIFFHVGSTATAGCIATQEDMVIKYLNALSANNNPYILIV